MRPISRYNAIINLPNREFRMKTASALRLSAVAVAVLILICCTPGERQNAPAATASAKNADQALVLYASGNVLVTGKGGWTPIAVGDLLERDRSVKTGARSACELQFGGRAAVRIEESTEVYLESLSLKAGETEIGLKQAAGTLLCKVEKLSGSERFRVRTPTAVCGVKGTEFAVILSEKRDTLLAVRQGTVSLAPAALDLEKLGAELKGGDPELAAALAELTQAERLVGEGRALSVSAAAEAAAEKSLAGVESAVKAVSGAQADAAAKAKFKAAVLTAKSELQKLVAAPRPQKDDERRLLDRIDDLSRRLEGAGSAGEDEKRYRVTLSAKPEDAEIFLSGESVGYGRFQGLFPEGEKLEFTVSKPGFAPQSLTVEAGKDPTGSFSVVLVREWAETGTGVGPAETGTIATQDAKGRGIAVTLGRQETLIPAGGLGMEFFPNATVTLLGRDPYRLLLPMWGDTYLLEGSDLRTWNNYTPALVKGGKGSFDNYSAYIDGVYRHTDGRLYGFYHAYDGEGFEGQKKIETEPGPFWYGRIGVAVSDDNGQTWEKKGPVIESFKPKSWAAYEGQTTRGVGDLALVREKNGRYLYLYYTEYSRVNGEQVHLCLARADIREQPPLPGAWKKYYQGGFTEDGLQGLDSPVVDSKYMDLADTQEPHVFYSKTLGCYVMVYAIAFWKEHAQNQGLKNSGFYIAYSDDGIGWSRGFRLIKDFVVPIDGKEFVWYPSVILDANSTADGWLVYGYSEKEGGRDKNLVPFYLAGRRISLKRK
jgi:hypothetical protein